MTYKLILLLAVTFTLKNASGQEKVWTKQAKMSEIIAFEKSISPNPRVLSQSVSLSKDFYPLADKYRVTNPLIVQREKVEYLPVYVAYFYTAEDSILRLVSVDWEKDRYGNFFDKQKLWVEEAKKLKTYNKEYERVRAIIMEQLGQPTKSDNKPKEVTSDRGNYFIREAEWDHNDYHAEIDMVFESMTYRIRFTMYWK
jgi:hypothetical protein